MEPERPIEKVLRAAAAKRRGEPGKTFSLHPMDRKTLQAEVEKVYGSKAVSDKREARGWAGLWPQIAWSFAFVFGLAAAVTMMLPRSGPSPLTLRLVKNESAKETPVPARSLDGNLPAQNQPASGRDERESDRVQRLATGQTKEAESQVATPARPAELSTEVAAGGPKLQQEQRSRYGLAPAAPPPQSSPSAVVTAREPAPEQRLMKAKDVAGAEASTTLADAKVQVTNAMRSQIVAESIDKQMKRSDTLKEEVAANSVSSPVPAASSALASRPSPSAQTHLALTIRQRFVQTASPAATLDAVAELAPAILHNFDFEQTDSAIRIIDQDGSIYIGSTQSSPLPAAVNRRFAERAASNGSPTGDATSSYFFNQTSSSALFSVSGTNLTSGQLVTFQGQLLAAPIQSSTVVTQSKKAAPAGSASIPTNIQLSGILKIGTNHPVEIRARPTERLRK